MAINTQQIGSYLKRRASGYGVVTAEDVAVEYNESTGAISEGGSLKDVVEDIYNQIESAQEVIENAKDLPFSLTGDPGDNDTLGSYLSSIGNGGSSSGGGSSSDPVNTGRAENVIYDDSNYYTTYSAFIAANPSSTMTEAEFNELSATADEKKIIVTVKQKINDIEGSVTSLSDNVGTAITSGLSAALNGIGATDIKYTPSYTGATQTTIGQYLDSIDDYVYSANQAKAQLDDLINSIQDLNNAATAVQNLQNIAADLQAGTDVNAQIVAVTQDTYNSSEFQKQANTIYLCYEPSQLQDVYEVVAAPSDDNGRVVGSGIYRDGTTIKIIAIPNDGFKFKKWTMNSEDLFDNPYEIDVNSTNVGTNGKINITAEFEAETIANSFVSRTESGSDVLYGKRTTVIGSGSIAAGGEGRTATINYTLYIVTDANTETQESKTKTVKITQENGTDVAVTYDMVVPVEGGCSINYRYTLNPRNLTGISLDHTSYTVEEGETPTIKVYKEYDAGSKAEITGADLSNVSIVYAGNSSEPAAGTATVTYTVGSTDYSATFDLVINANSSSSPGE